MDAWDGAAPSVLWFPPGGAIVCGDAAGCLDGLSTMPPLRGRKAGLVYLDPPFSCRDMFPGHPPDAAFRMWTDSLERCVASAARMLGASGVLCIHIDHAGAPLLEAIARARWSRAGYRGGMTWLRTKGRLVEQTCSGDHDHILVMSERPLARPVGDVKVGTLADGQAAVSRPGDTAVFPHAKPVGLGRFLIEAYTRPDDVVADPFLGSGTTAVAAHRAGRHWVGIERDPSTLMNVTVPRLWRELQTRVVDDGASRPRTAS